MRGLIPRDDHRAANSSLRQNRPRSQIPSLHDRNGQAWLYPGLAADLSNQPYFVLRHA